MFLLIIININKGSLNNWLLDGICAWAMPYLLIIYNIII